MTSKKLRSKEWKYVCMLLKRYDSHEDKELKVLRHLRAYSKANNNRLYNNFLEMVQQDAV